MFGLKGGKEAVHGIGFAERTEHAVQYEVLFAGECRPSAQVGGFQLVDIAHQKPVDDLHPAGKYLVVADTLGVAFVNKRLLYRDRKSTRLNSSHVKISYA